MTQDKNQNIYIYLGANNLYGCAMSKFLATGGFKQRDPKNVGSNKYSTNSFKGCVSKIDLEFSK